MKRIPHQATATEEECLSSRLFHVGDRHSGLNISIDTRAALGINPQSKTELGGKTSPAKLPAAIKAKVATFGQKGLKLGSWFRRQFSWVFTVADLVWAILRMVFWERYEFLADTKKRHLILKETPSYTKGRESHIVSLNSIHTPPVTTAKFQDILAAFSNLTRPNRQPSKCKLRVNRTVKTEGAPVFARPRRLAMEKLKIAGAEFHCML